MERRAMRVIRVDRHVARCAAALVAALCLGPGAAACARQPVTYTVRIDGSRFEPTELRVNVGDTIGWINQDIVPHTATSRTGGFDSGELPLGQSWTYRPTQSGEFAYLCAFHPAMQAKLIVR